MDAAAGPMSNLFAPLCLLCCRFLQRLLLLPPPPAVADAMQQTLQQLLLLSISPVKFDDVREREKEVEEGGSDRDRGTTTTQKEHQEQLLLPSGKVPHVGKVTQLISTRKVGKKNGRDGITPHHLEGDAFTCPVVAEKNRIPMKCL